MERDPDLGAAIRDARSGLSQATLRDRLVAAGFPVDQTTISKWEVGTTAVPIAALPVIEEALGLARGWLLVAAGYVERQVDTRSAIALDPALTPDARDWLLAAYDAALSTSAKTRPSTPPTK